MTIHDTILKMLRVYDEKALTKYVTTAVKALQTEKPSDIRKALRCRYHRFDNAHLFRYRDDKKGNWTWFNPSSPSNVVKMGTTRQVLQVLARRIRNVLTTPDMYDSLVCSNEDVDNLLKTYNLEKYIK